MGARLAAAGLEGTTADYSREALLVAVTAVNLAVAWSGVFGRWFPPNDTKHWIVRARFYAGWQMPASESVGQFATHPVAIASLALLLVIVGSAVLAAKLWTVLVYVWATTAVYVTARELFSGRVALLAFATVGLGQYLYLDLLSFGGVPQLVAVGFLTLCVGALVRARRTGAAADRLAYAALLTLGLFAHPPSSPVFVATLGAVSVAVGVATREVRAVVDTVVDSLVPSLVFAVYLAAQWRVFSLYVSATDGHGIATLVQMATRSPPLGAAAVGVAASLPLVVHVVGANPDVASAFAPTPASERRPRRLGASPRLDAHASALIVAGWLLAPLSVAVAVGALPGVETELARVAYFLVAPFVTAFALYVCVVAWVGAGVLGRVVRNPDLRGAVWPALTVAVALLVLLPGFAWSTGYYADARVYYGVKNPDSTRAVVGWVDENGPVDGQVAAPFYVAPWIEALAGESALTATPASGSYRPDEARESDAYQRLEHLRWNGDTPHNVRAARRTIREYDVRYVVLPNNWRKTRFDPLGHQVYATDRLVVYAVDADAPEVDA